MNISTNNNAINAHLAMLKTSRSENVSAQKLSTGLRINSTADDATGAAVASKMQAAIMGIDMATRAISDGVGFLELQESGINTVRIIIQRMQELATQMASGTYTDEQRSLAQVEMDALTEQIGSIADNTKFQGHQALSVGAPPGDFTPFRLQAGPTSEEAIDLPKVPMNLLYLTMTVQTPAIKDVSSQSAALRALDELLVINANYTEFQASAGTLKNRLHYVLNNLANGQVQYSAALGRVIDTDYAEETANLMKYKTLNRAATSMLSNSVEMPRTNAQMILDSTKL